MKLFQLKQFSISQNRSALKIGTDAMILGAWAKVRPRSKILDIGTGTGILALMLAQRFPNAHIIGVEPDLGSFLDATQNFSEAPWSDRLVAKNLSFQGYIKEYPQASFDHIISNPPYFSSPGKAIITSKVNARHTVNLTHETLIIHSLQLLRKGGKISLILPTQPGEECLAFAKRQGLYTHRICRIRSKKDKPVTRYLIEWGLEPERQVDSELIVMDQKGPKGYSPGFCNLTDAFYPFM